MADKVEVLVVTSRVKARVKKDGMRTSGGFIEALSSKVAAHLKAAQAKATEAKRKTLQAEDLSP